jgi:fluoride exporter
MLPDAPERRHRREVLRVRPYLWAAAGGVLGALARWGVMPAQPHSPGSWLWTTLTVNLTGCFLIGVLIAVLAARAPEAPWLRPFLFTGILGGYTTYSTFAVEVVQAVEEGRWVLAAAYVVVSVVGGVLAVVAGAAGARAVVGGPIP